MVQYVHRSGSMHKGEEMEKALYEAAEVKSAPSFNENEVRVKLRLLDGHFYEDVLFKGSLKNLIGIIEKGEMLYVEKINGDQIFVNSKLVVDFVLS